MIFFDEPPGLDDNGHKAVEGASLIDGNSNKPTSGGLLRGPGWPGCSSKNGQVIVESPCKTRLQQVDLSRGCTIAPIPVL